MRLVLDWLGRGGASPVPMSRGSLMLVYRSNPDGYVAGVSGTGFLSGTVDPWVALRISDKETSVSGRECDGGEIRPSLGGAYSLAGVFWWETLFFLCWVVAEPSLR